MRNHYDFIVIGGGGGSAGFSAAARADEFIKKIAGESAE